jgi:NAD(P)-dependent dehydrogenase (short-subunit alcohol dehydrogenase family)
MPNAAKVWFITGTSKGFGRVWAEAALTRGDMVAATARDVGALASLVETFGDNVLPLTLDVVDKAADEAAVKAAHDHFGRLDVVINNAGYGLFGTVEEVTEEQVRAQFDANVFGALWVTKAALPYMRAQGSGHIIQVSSFGGVNALPSRGLYNASKWALEGFTQALNGEVKDLGIRVTLVEPGGYTTDWMGPSCVRAETLPAYDDLHTAFEANWLGQDRGDPEATGPAMLAVVDADDPPLRIFFGRGPLELTRAEYARRIALWEQWNEVSEMAHGH